MAIQRFNVSKFPTSIIYLRGNQTAGGPLVVWIPGNPGLLDYYEPFVLALSEKHPEWDILAISHAGMNSKHDDGKDQAAQCIFTLDEQIQHKIEVINHFSSPEKRLYIMGHSVGAYMAQKVAISSQLVGAVERIELITPTVVNIHSSQKGMQMTPLLSRITKLPQYAGWLSNLIFNKILPASWSRWLIARLMNCEVGSSVQLASQWFLQGPELVVQSLGLATYEMQQIRNDWDFQSRLIGVCNAKQISVRFLFSSSDHWVSDKTRLELIDFYQQKCDPQLLQIDVSDEIPHSFVVSHTHYAVRTFF